MLFMRKIVLLIPIVLLAACSSSTETPEKGILFSESSDSLGAKTRTNDVEEPEGPQYQQPTMELLKGKAQLFPARYPLQRYPHSQVAMVDVRRNRLPGCKNLVMLSTMDAYGEIDGFYKQKLLAQNWKKTFEYENSIYKCSRWVKGDMECEVRICPELKVEDKKYIQLLTGIRRKQIRS